jgi:hypothetical protein
LSAISRCRGLDAHAKSQGEDLQDGEEFQEIAGSGEVIRDGEDFQEFDLAQMRILNTSAVGKDGPTP